MSAAQNIRVVIMAGGTGGHVYPGLAVARELMARGCDVAWLGTRRGIEARVVPEAGIPIHYLEIQGVRGKGVSSVVGAPLKIFKAVNQVRKWFAQNRPQVVVGLGGYAAGPGGIAAWTMGIPLVIHEQNARPGTTNKILRRFAKRVLVAFEHALPKSLWVGNPVRADISEITEPATRLPAASSQPLRLLILGGSLGAQAINELVPQALKNIAPEQRPHVTHQTGEKHLQATQQHYRDHAVQANIVPFIEDMAEALAQADLVICRSGALTVAELSAAGCASILVPFPYAIDDHQTANAQWLVDHKAALLRQQKDLTAEELTGLIKEFSHNRTGLIAMATAARAVAKPHATQVFADTCLEVAHG